MKIEYALVVAFALFVVLLWVAIYFDFIAPTVCEKQGGFNFWYNQEEYCCLNNIVYVDGNTMNEKVIVSGLNCSIGDLNG